MRSVRLVLIAVSLLTLPLAMADGIATLLVVEQEGCPYCKRFDAEIAPAYPNTPEAELAPLRRVDLSQPWPQDLSAIRPPLVTPTFILVSKGREIDRLSGYRGDEFFWFLLGEMLAKLDNQAQ